MWHNYLKFTLRGLRHNKTYAFINIIGLALGLSVCLIIMLYIHHEINYDQHHEFGDQLYRICSTTDQTEKGWAAMAAPFAEGLKTDFPQVEASARLLNLAGIGAEKVNLQFEDQHVVSTNNFFVDSAYFDMFTYDFVAGDKQTALKRPNTVVISEGIAQQLFGQQSPIGQTIQVSMRFGNQPFEVTGVFKQSQRSHIPANMLLSMDNNLIGGMVQSLTSWISNNIFYTYVKLSADSDVAEFEMQLPDFLDKKAGEALAQAGFNRSLLVQPVKDIHLHSNLNYEIVPNGSIQTLYILSSLGLFVLFIACINFMNLTTAQTEKQTKEIGVRKAVGADRHSLIKQYLTSSILLSIIALLVSMGLVVALLPYFNQLAKTNLSIISEPDLWTWVLSLTIITGIIAGSYPAFYLSSFQPSKALNKQSPGSYRAANVRKGLVVFQFVVSTCLILGAMVIWKQLHFMQNQALGFKKTQQLVLSLENETVMRNYSALKEALLNLPGVKTITSGSSYPGVQNINSMIFYGEGQASTDITEITMAAIEADYLETLGIQLLGGIPFQTPISADSNKIILNEAAVEELGYQVDDAVGRFAFFDWQGVHHRYQIVGVVKNFHFESLHHTIKPFGFATSFFDNPYNYLIASVESNDYSGLLGAIEQEWQSINSGTPFDYSFLDQEFDRNYAKEAITSNVVTLFTMIALLIAAVGLFGLTAFATERRKKEIGVRKVLGASVLNILGLLSKDFIKLVLIGLLIGIPTSLYFMQRWLQNFAYRAEIQWWVIVLTGAVAVGIAFLTMSFHSVKAALVDPVDSLKRE